MAEEELTKKELTKDELTYEGFVFTNATDVELAKNEMKKIEYIKNKVDFKDMEMLRGVYDKAIENKSFVTPIGLSYLHEMGEYIDSHSEETKVQPIPLSTSFRRLSLSSGSTPVKSRVTKAQKEELDLQTKNRNLRIICAILVGVIIALFAITFSGTNPNIINYKIAITNEYSAWEQDLTEREAIIREKERNLNIEH